MVTMLAARFYGAYDIRVDEIDEPLIPSDSVLIRIEAVGICGTDKAIFRGSYDIPYKPLILGHEVSGIVEDVGKDVPPDIVGNRVVSEINLTCGECWYCLNDLNIHCINRSVIGITRDGGMAEYLVVPYSNIHVVDLDPIYAVFVEPLAAVLKMSLVEDIPESSNILIIGSGTIALLAIQVLRMCSPRNIVVLVRGDSPKKNLVLSLEPDFLVDYDSLPDIMERLTPEGLGFDYVVEAAGDPDALMSAVDLVRPRGVILAKSTFGGSAVLNYNSLVVKEVKLVGSRCGPFKKAIELISDGSIKVKDLVSRVYMLSNSKEAFEYSLSRRSVKVVVRPTP